MEPIQPSDELIIAFATSRTTQRLHDRFTRFYLQELTPITLTYPLNSITYKLIYRDNIIYIHVQSPFDSSFIDYFSIYHPHFL